MSSPNLLDHVAHLLRRADRGVSRLGSNLVAFSNRGSAELTPFRRWLRRYGYVEEAFDATDLEFSSWALLLSHPFGPPNAKTVEFGLWAAWAEVTSQMGGERQNGAAGDGQAAHTGPTGTPADSGRQCARTDAQASALCQC
jgi:hypothetical protein